MTTTLKTRIAEALQESGYSQTDLAVACGVRPASVNGWISGQTKSLKSSSANRAATFLGVNPLWLIEGKGPKRANPRAAQESVTHQGVIRISEEDDDQEDADRVPVFFTVKWMRKRGLSPDKLLTARVVGDSMAPSLLEGDTVIINVDDKTPQEGDVFAVSIHNDPVVMKRFRRESGFWWLYSDWPMQVQYPPKKLDDDVKVVGRVVFRQTERI